MQPLRGVTRDVVQSSGGGFRLPRLSCTSCSKKFLSSHFFPGLTAALDQHRNSSKMHFVFFFFFFGSQRQKHTQTKMFK